MRRDGARSQWKRRDMAAVLGALVVIHCGDTPSSPSLDMSASTDMVTVVEEDAPLDTSPASCAQEGFDEGSQGEMVCREDVMFRCDQGQWQDLATPCTTGARAMTLVQPRLTQAQPGAPIYVLSAQLLNDGGTRLYKVTCSWEMTSSDGVQSYEMGTFRNLPATAVEPGARLELQVRWEPVNLLPLSLAAQIACQAEDALAETTQAQISTSL